MSWKSIDEAPASPEQTVLLKGTLAEAPRSYRRLRGRSALTLGTLALLLHKLISWSAALTAHVVAAAVLVTLVVAAQEEDTGGTLVWAKLRAPDQGEEGKDLAPVFDPPPKEEKKPEPDPPKVEVPPTPEPPKPDPAPAKVVAKSPEPPAESPNPTVGPVTESPKPATIGGGASASGRPPAAAVSDHEVEKDPTEAIRKRRAGELGRLRGGTRKQIVVVSGVYDRVQDVLDKLGIPYTMVDAEKVASMDLSECLALLINCHNSYATYATKTTDTRAIEREIARLEERQKTLRKRLEAATDRRTKQLLNLELLANSSELAEYRRQHEAVTRATRMGERIADFVRGGGYLFTSDWGLTLVEQALPGYVRNGGLVGPRTVDIRAPRGKEQHALLEEVFYEPARGGTTTSLRKFRWEIDSSSYYIQVQRPTVEVLVESAQLGKFPAVAVAFAPDGEKSGKVLHVLSHFQKQATQQGDYALQNMLINFLLDRTRPGAERLKDAKAKIPVAVTEPAAPAPVPELGDLFEDAQKRFSLLLPRGWTARAGTDKGRAALLSGEGGEGWVRLAGAPPSEGSRTYDWDRWLPALQAELGEGVKVARKMQAFCCGQPALQLSVTCTREGKRIGALVYAAASPQGVVALVWTAEEGRFRELEAAFEKASRTLTVPRL